MKDLRKFLRKHGIRQNYLAKKLRISDTLLRYRIHQGLTNQERFDIEAALADHIKKLAEDLRKFNLLNPEK